MRKASIHGYSDRISVAPGETIRFLVSCEEEGAYRADIVRVIQGDTNPAGPGFKEEALDTPANGEYPARFQPTYSGSYVTVDDPDGRLNLDRAFTLHAFIYPTTPMRAAQYDEEEQAGIETDQRDTALPGSPGQGILARWAAGSGAGYAMTIDDGRLTLVVGDGSGAPARLSAATPLVGNTWYSAAVSYDPASGQARIYQRPVINAVNSHLSRIATLRYSADAEGTLRGRAGDAQAPFLIAGYARRAGDGDPANVAGHYNGKIDRPTVFSRALSVADLDALTDGGSPPAAGLVARWDFAAGIGPNGIPTDRVTDAGPLGLHGTCVNLPARGMTGHNWVGREEHFIHAPEQYGAIHFHDDDLDDCRWQADFELTIPADMRSDSYAARLRLGDSEEYIPFFVLPPRGRATSKVLLLLPTASYMAYANDHIAMDAPVAQAILGHTPVIDEQLVYLYTHTEFGLSTYDLHSDGSGVCYSSRLRPIINMRPKFRHAAGSVWQYPADLHLTDWLHARNIQFDVATDEELHAEGAALLKRYNVVMTGSHPEYYSERMLDAWEEYLADGGRGMYLGGNGFYWIISYHPEKPHVMEVRKGESGSRAWQAKPGEYFHATSGERGGLWRNRARSPQKLWGVGFTTEGFDYCAGFRQLPDARDPRAAFIFEGVAPDEVIGDFGLAGGGASGYEQDRYDLALGTPPNALLLASSEGGHSDNYPHVVEEIFFMYPGMGGTQDFQVRGDLVYFPTTNGGAVFSFSSISWPGSLAHNDYVNNVSRITENVLRRFAQDGPLTQVPVPDERAAVRRLYPRPAEVALEDIYRDLGRPAPPAARPYVAVNMVTTVDGAVALGGKAQGIGSRVDRALMRQLRAHADALLVGAGTLRAENVDPTVPAVLEPERVARGQTRQPLAVTLTASGDLPLARGFFSTERVQRVVLACRETPAERIAALRERAHVLIVGESRPDLVAGLRRLRAEFGVRWLLCEGGPSVNAALLRARLLDELFWTVAPTLAGGDALGMLGPAVLAPELRPRLALLSAYLHADELFLRYRVNST